MRTFFLLALLTILGTCVRAQGIVIDLTGAGAGNQPVGNCNSEIPVPDCSVHDGNMEFTIAPGDRFGLYFAWENTGAATFAEVRATDEMGNPQFNPVTEPLAPGESATITSFLSAPQTPGFYPVLVTVTARDENDREDTRQFRYFITVDAALPVVWTGVEAVADDKGAVAVTWGVAAAGQNAAFFVERSAVGGAFVEVAAGVDAEWVAGAGAYRYRDEAPPAGELLYRIRQRDYDGTETVSPVARVTVGGEAVGYPNPVGNRLFLRGVEPEAGGQVYDAAGRRVLSFARLPEAGLDVSGLRAGSYWVRVGERLVGVVKR